MNQAARRSRTRRDSSRRSGRCITYRIPVEMVDALIGKEVKLEDIAERVKPPRRQWLQSDLASAFEKRKFIYADRYGHDRFMVVDVETGEILWDRPYLNIEALEKYGYLISRHRVAIFSA